MPTSNQKSRTTSQKLERSRDQFGYKHPRTLKEIEARADAMRRKAAEA